jgi:DNA-binding beta-propeller fold protein YncE
MNQGIGALMAGVSQTAMLGAVALTAVSVAAATAMRPLPAPPPHYGFIRQIRLAGEQVWDYDYLSIDAAARRLYVAHGDHVDVIDLDSDSPVGSIADTPGAHGVAIAHELGRGFVSNGRSSQASVVDLNSLATIARVATDDGPDAIL